jgi:hypothetical protein
MSSSKDGFFVAYLTLQSLIFSEMIQTGIR